MSASRTLPLFDDAVSPASWNERMTEGEYAVLYSDIAGPAGSSPFCTVFAILADAENYARDQVTVRPTLRCRIYDHHGLAFQPVREFTGAAYKGESEMSPRLRRWSGAALVSIGTGLVLFDWMHDFRLSWPGVVGSRLLIPGIILLVTEALIAVHAREKQRQAAREIHA